MTAVPILERGLTAVALNDYFKSEPRIAELDGTLADQTCDAACNNVGAGRRSFGQPNPLARELARPRERRGGGRCDAPTASSRMHHASRGATTGGPRAVSGFRLRGGYAIDAARAYGGMGRVGQALAGLRYGGMP